MPTKIPVANSFTGVANFLGIVGITGSLIFVALELRQSMLCSYWSLGSSKTKKAHINRALKTSLDLRGLVFGGGGWT